MNITVTQSDIDDGKQKDCRYCPIALAVMREFDRGVVDVAFGDAIHYTFKSEKDPEEYTFIDVATIKRAPLPTEALRFVYAFDRKIPVTPISFPLEWTVGRVSASEQANSTGERSETGEEKP